MVYKGKITIERLSKHKVICFFSLTLCLSGMLLLLNIFAFPQVSQYITFPQYAPSIAALIMVLVFNGKQATKNYATALIRSKASWQWHLAAIGLPVTLILASYLFFCIYMHKSFSISNLSVYAFPAIVLGSIGEEIGWRSYALPILMKKYSPITSSVVLGIYWGLWHMLFGNGLLIVILFTITTIELSLVFTWFYLRTKRDLWISVVIHSTINIATRMLFVSNLSVTILIIEAVLFALHCIPIIYRLNRIAKTLAIP